MPNSRLFDRAIIRLSPLDDDENVADFLQGLVTNDVSGQLPVWAALLSAQGKAMFDFLVWDGEDGALLVDCEAARTDDLVKRLSLYRLRRKIAIERDDSMGAFWQPKLGVGGIPDPRLAELGQRWLGPVSDEDIPADKGWRTHRLSLGVPEGHAELGDVLWLETNAVDLGGVSFEKGCYIGQENTARMNWRQKVNRRLVVVPIDQSIEKRQKAAYPELGLAVDHLRVADIDPAIAPDWMKLTSGEA
ncbi:folate-binding protein [Pontixanthobacter sp. CEM42]|uniref:CAF17-like 4Fe-4S cluster assembly/insertion protein YgfZ n=1 Tax=Pontixanthobacter sp. CEM42 TaxID=2792077 RepID=UPI001ADF889B|nr:folate-binding protein [Pontixanthobacter sp. CEM42]